MAATMTFLLALAAACAAAGFVYLQPGPASTATTSTRAEITDGYLQGAVAANQARSVVQAQQLTDGWQAGIIGVAGANPSGLTDGWEAKLFGAAAVSEEPIGGWESHLFR
ncbi:MAG TPA: hypothetical protein VFH90_00255 [Candidatus Limnocylindria bacterium]|nr:hypothetical protein [Candidatus Limnocylindria bacterium]